MLNRNLYISPMCRLAGFIALNSETGHCNSQAVATMLKSQVHRGPDCHGNLYNTHAYMGNRRMAVIDVSAYTNLTMTTADKDVWIANNGEASNFVQLKEKYSWLVSTTFTLLPIRRYYCTF